MKTMVLVLSFVLVSTGSLLFPQTLGTVEYVEGRVDIIRDGKRISRIDMGFSIENMDQVSTGNNASLSLSFLPVSGITGVLAIGENSSAIIRKDQLSSQSTNDIFLLGGSVSLKVKKMTGTDASVRVRTPSSVLGVRGTEFNVVTFNANTLVGCREGEVFCYAYSGVTGIQGSPVNGVSAVPGLLVEIPESGVLSTADFPKGDYYEQWDAVMARWKSFHVDIISADPVVFLDRLVPSWETAVERVLQDAAALRRNETASKWLDTARRGGEIGTRQNWVTERPKVMKDMLAMRPHLVLATIPWLRLNDILSLVSEKDMDRTLSNGQTLRAFVRRFNRDSKDFSAAMNLFYALEKQYMIRNDGLSPFMDF